MQPITHGIVSKANSFNFAATLTSVLVGDTVSFTLGILAGEEIRVDWGDGVIVIYTAITTGQLIVTGVTVTTNTIKITASSEKTDSSSFTVRSASFDTVTSVDVTNASLLTQISMNDSSVMKSFAASNTGRLRNIPQAFQNNSSIESVSGLTAALQGSSALAFNNAVSLICISAINTLDSTSTFDMFLNTPSLTAPNASEQTALLAGSNYVNASPCP